MCQIKLKLEAKNTIEEYELRLLIRIASKMGQLIILL